MQSILQLTLCTVEVRLFFHTLYCCLATLLYSQLATGLTQVWLKALCWAKMLNQYQDMLENYVAQGNA